VEVVRSYIVEPKNGHTSTRLKRYSLPENPPTKRRASILWLTLFVCSSIRLMTFVRKRRMSSDTTIINEVGSADLIDYRVKHCPTKEVSRYSQISIDQSNGGVVLIFDVEACEMEHRVFEEKGKVRSNKREEVRAHKRSPNHRRQSPDTPISPPH
jgi:hypothetical protein